MSSLPNLLTIARIAIIPLFVAAFYFSGEESRWLAFSLFCLAAITDAIDGVIARRWQAESSLGRMLDPIAARPGERMFQGVTGVALIVLWIAAGLTLYTGYAYLRAGLIHARMAPHKRPATRTRVQRQQNPV